MIPRIFFFKYNFKPKCIHYMFIVEQILLSLNLFMRRFKLIIIYRYLSIFIHTRLKILITRKNSRTFTLGFGDKLFFDVFEVWHGLGISLLEPFLLKVSRVALARQETVRTLHLNHSHKSWLSRNRHIFKYFRNHAWETEI